MGFSSTEIIFTLAFVLIMRRMLLLRQALEIEAPTWQEILSFRLHGILRLSVVILIGMQGIIFLFRNIFA